MLKSMLTGMMVAYKAYPTCKAWRCHSTAAETAVEVLRRQWRRVRCPSSLLFVHAQAPPRLLSSNAPALCLQHLPKLPENAKFFPVDPAACHFGLGTFGLVLKSEMISDDSFKHFIFASSRARGPFMAPYLQVSRAPGACRAVGASHLSRCKGGAQAAAVPAAAAHVHRSGLHLVRVPCTQG